jgi:mono/diheme cytochrome c family protein
MKRLRLATAWLGLLCGWAVLTTGCSLHSPTRPEEQPIRPDQVKDFAVLFRQHCQGCHGQDGEHGPAPPLNDPRFLHIFSKGDIEELLIMGRSEHLMPAFAKSNGGTLTDEQVTILAQGLGQHWGAKEWTEATPPYGYKPGNAEAGKKVFALACATCHGDHGEGGVRGGAINQPAFLELASNDMLRRIVITGRKDLGMPAYNDTEWRAPEFKPLTSEQINDVVALLASWRRGEQSGDER